MKALLDLPAPEGLLLPFGVITDQSWFYVVARNMLHMMVLFENIFFNLNHSNPFDLNPCSLGLAIEHGFTEKHVEGDFL